MSNGFAHFRVPTHALIVIGACARVDSINIEARMFWCDEKHHNGNCDRLSHARLLSQGWLQDRAEDACRIHHRLLSNGLTIVRHD